MSNKAEWISYICGALLVLIWKYARYLYASKSFNKNWRQSTLEWFFAPTAENAVSWVTTIGVVWVIGAAYISRIDFKVSDWLNAIPLHASMAFLLGSLMEFAAPNCAKWILKKLPGGS